MHGIDNIYTFIVFLQYIAVEAAAYIMFFFFEM